MNVLKCYLTLTIATIGKSPTLRFFNSTVYIGMFSHRCVFCMTCETIPVMLMSLLHISYCFKCDFFIYFHSKASTQ